MRRTVPTVTEDDSAEQVAEVMREENVGFLPVVEHARTRRLVGVITDRDLAMTVVADNRVPRATPIRDLVTRTVVTVAPDDEVLEAERRMAQAEVRRLPVVDERGAVLGVVSLHDIAQEEDDRRMGRVWREVSKTSARL